MAPKRSAAADDHSTQTPTPRRSGRTVHDGRMGLKYADYHEVDEAMNPTRARNLRHKFKIYSRPQDIADDDHVAPSVESVTPPLPPKKKPRKTSRLSKVDTIDEDSEESSSIPANPWPLTPQFTGTLVGTRYPDASMTAAVATPNSSHHVVTPLGQGPVVSFRQVNFISLPIEVFREQYHQAWDTFARSETSEQRATRLLPVVNAAWETFNMPGLDHHSSHDDDALDHADDQQGGGDDSETNDTCPIRHASESSTPGEDSAKDRRDTDFASPPAIDPQPPEDIQDDIVSSSDPNDPGGQPQQSPSNQSDASIKIQQSPRIRSSPSDDDDDQRRTPLQDVDQDTLNISPAYHERMQIKLAASRPERLAAQGDSQPNPYSTGDVTTFSAFGPHTQDSHGDWNGSQGHPEDLFPESFFQVGHGSND